tara:strand:+ start:1195 stop:1785 length:591 start_codon:yes stop_codon:yes gene_type:complete
MKLIRILLILIVTYTGPQPWVKAEDIREFEIEGLAIGKSLLSFFDEKHIIDNNANYPYHNDKFYVSSFYNEKFYETYESIEIHLKKDDDKYKIYAVDGMIFYENIDACYPKQQQIAQELDKMFKNTKMVDAGIRKLDNDYTGKSKLKTFYWKFSSGDFLAVECYDWSEEIFEKNSWYDNLRISIVSKELNDWLIQN